MLFAAGFGTRMGELTRSRPKPLIPVAGRALLDHALDLAAGAGLSRQVVNAHYLAEQVVAHLDGTGIPVAVEAPDILDTGGGLRAALPLLGPGPVFTLNTDAVWTGPNPLATLAGGWDPARMDALLLLMPTARIRGEVGRGDFLLDGWGRLRRPAPGALAPYLFAGVQVMAPALLAGEAEGRFSLNRPFDRAIAAGRLHGLVHDGEWFHLSTPPDLARTERWLREGRA